MALIFEDVVIEKHIETKVTGKECDICGIRDDNEDVAMWEDFDYYDDNREVCVSYQDEYGEYTDYCVCPLCFEKHFLKILNKKRLNND